MSERNCPKCGYGLGAQLARLRMLNCPSCGTSLFLDDDQLRLAGEQGVMHDLPMLFGLGDTVGIGGQDFRPVGHVRYSYGRGTWDEFWALDSLGGGAWISVDEGDVVVQRAVGSDMATPPVLADRISHSGIPFTVTETEDATCVALRGDFPSLLRIGERHRFVNATAADGALLSGEFGPDGAEWFLGEWADPFDVTVTKA